MSSSSEIISQLIQRREDLHPDDPAIENIWNELVGILKDDEVKTISLLKSSSKEELYWLCEIFEDLSLEFQSSKFIDCLLELQKKYPEADMDEKGGETIVSHALQKHAGRNPNIWERLKEGQIK